MKGAIWQMLALHVVLGCAPRATQQSARAAPPSRVELVCADSEKELQRVWSAEATSAVRRAIVAVPEVGGEASADLVVKEFDAAAKSWRLAHDQNCTGVPDEPRARLARAQIERCLDDVLVALDTLSEALKGADAEALSHVRDALAIVSEKGTVCSRPTIYAYYGGAAESSASAQARRALSRAEVLLRLDRKQAGEIAFQSARAAVPSSSDTRLDVLTTISEGTRLNGARQYSQAAQQAELAMQRARAADYLGGQAEAAALQSFIARDQAKHRAELEWLEQALPLYRATFGEGSLRTSAIVDHIGNAYLSLDQFDDALEWFRKALAARQGWPGPDHPATLAVENHVAAVLLARGAFVEAALAYQAILTRASGNGLNVGPIADAYAGLGHALSEQGKSDEALAALNKALSLQTRLGPDREEMAVVINLIAMVRQDKAEFEAALKGFLEALAIIERRRGKDDEQVGKASSNIGGLHDQRGNYQAALEWHQRALEIFLRVHGTEHSLTGRAYNNIGLVQNHLHQYTEAIASLERARWIKERTLGPQHPSTASTYNNLGLAYANNLQYAEAIELYKMAIDIQERVLGKDHISVAATYNNLGSAEQAQLKLKEALVWYEKALAIKERVLGTSHPSTANTYNNIGTVQSELRNFDAAMASHRKALAIKERVLGRDHPSTVGSYQNLGALEAKRGRYEEALKWYDIALEINRRVSGDGSEAARRTELRIAEVERLRRGRH